MQILKVIPLFAALFFSPVLAEEVKLNAKAPDFELANQDGKKMKLSDHAGKNVILSFSRAHW